MFTAVQNRAEKTRPALPLMNRTASAGHGVTAVRLLLVGPCCINGFGEIAGVVNVEDRQQEIKRVGLRVEVRPKTLFIQLSFVAFDDLRVGGAQGLAVQKHHTKSRQLVELHIARPEGLVCGFQSGVGFALLCVARGGRIGQWRRLRSGAFGGGDLGRLR